MTQRDPLDPDKLTARVREAGPQGHHPGSIGPSDSSDSGSDLIGPGLIDDDLIGLDRGTTEDSEGGHLNSSDPGASLGDVDGDDTSDRYGTGEHITAGKDPDIRIGNDIAPDRIVTAAEAGLGGGLDQAEEARLGITDEELSEGMDASGNERRASEAKAAASAKASKGERSSASATDSTTEKSSTAGKPTGKAPRR